MGKGTRLVFEYIWESHFKCGMLQDVDKNTLFLSGEESIDFGKLLPFLETEKFVSQVF